MDLLDKFKVGTEISLNGPLSGEKEIYTCLFKSKYRADFTNYNGATLIIKKGDLVPPLHPFFKDMNIKLTPKRKLSEEEKKERVAMRKVNNFLNKMEEEESNGRGDDISSITDFMSLLSKIPR